MKRKKGEKVGATKLSILRREAKSEGKEEEKDGNTKIEAEELKGWWEEQNGKERGTKQRRRRGGGGRGGEGRERRKRGSGRNERGVKKKEEMKAAKADNHNHDVIWERDKRNEGQKL